MSRIRVVFSIGAMHGGGSERQLVSLLRHLDRERFEPSLYLVYRSGPLLSEVPTDVPIVAFAERVATGGLYVPGLMHRHRVADLARYLQECSADISYDRTFLMTLIAAEAAQRVGVANVSTIVTDPRLGFAPVAGRFQWFKKRILRRLYCHSNCVLANSNGSARSAESFYNLKLNSVATHYNGVDIEDVQRRAEDIIDDSWWNAAADGRRVFRIVTAGRLNREKGFHLLIEAVDRLRSTYTDTEFRLAILGEGPGRDALELQIRKASLTDCVCLMGFRNDAPAWYNTADLFVLASYLEGMPNVLLEAMACQTPVLSTDCPSGPREVLDDGNCGVLCKTDSVDALVDGMSAFLKDGTLGQKFVSEGLDRVVSEFSIQTATKRLERIFEDVVRLRNETRR